MPIFVCNILVRKAKLLVELEISSSNTSDNDSDNHDLEEDLEAQVDEKMQKMIAVHQKMFSDAENNIKDAQAWYKKDYDRKRSHCEVNLYFFNISNCDTNFQEFGIGTLVLRNNKRDSKKGYKMQPKWLGPYAIESSIGKDLYRIKNTSTKRVLKQAVHSVQLKPYKFRPALQHLRIQPPNTSESTTGQPFNTSESTSSQPPTTSESTSSQPPPPLSLLQVSSSPPPNPLQASPPPPPSLLQVNSSPLPSPLQTSPPPPPSPLQANPSPPLSPLQASPHHLQVCFTPASLCLRVYFSYCI